MVQILNYNAKKFREMSVDEIHEYAESYYENFGSDYNWYKFAAIEWLKWYKLFKEMNMQEQAISNIKAFIRWNKKAMQERIRINAKEGED